MTSVITPSLSKAPATDHTMSGEREARTIAELFDRFGTVTYRLAYSITEDRTIAEQVVSQSFATAWREVGRSSPNAFFAMLERTVRSNAVQHRAARKSGAVAFADGRDCQDSAIADALGRLSQEQRQTLALAYFGGLGVAAIASELAQPISIVKANLQAGLRHVRSVIAKHGVPA